MLSVEMMKQIERDNKKVKVYFVYNGENTLYVKTLDDALSYIRDNFNSFEAEDGEFIASIGMKDMTQDEFDKLPEFDG